MTALPVVLAGCDPNIAGTGGPLPTFDSTSILVVVTSTGSPEPGTYALKAEASILGDGDASDLRYAWSVIQGACVFEPSADQETVTLRATEAGPIKVQVRVSLEEGTATGSGVYETTVDGGLNVTAVAVPNASNNGDFQFFADVVETGEFTYKWENDPTALTELTFEDSGEASLNITATEENSYTVIVRVARADAEGPEDWGWAQVWFSYGRFLYEIVCPEQVVLGDEDTIERSLVNAPNNPTGDRICADYDITDGEAAILDEDDFGLTVRFDTLGDVTVTLHMLNTHTGRNGDPESDCDAFTVGGDDVFIGELTDQCIIEVVRDEAEDIDTDGDEGEEGDGTNGNGDAPAGPSDDPCGDYVDYYNGLPCITTPLHPSSSCDTMSVLVCLGIEEFYDCLIENTNCVNGDLVEEIDACGRLLDCR